MNHLGTTDLIEFVSLPFVAGSRPHSRGSFSGLTPLSFQDYDEPARFPDDLVGGTRGESIKIGLLFQAKSLSDQVRFLDDLV